MANLLTPVLDQLITSTRYMLNQPDSNNSFWTDDELTEYLNEGVRRYFQEVVILFQGEFMTTASLDLTAGVETVTLPTDCFEVKTLYKSVNAGQRYEVLDYNNNVTDGYQTDASNDPTTYLPYYFFRGNSLVLRPMPQFDETAGLQLEYVQFPPEMVFGGDALTNQMAPVFKDLVVAYAAYKAKLKESLATGQPVHTIAEQHAQNLWVAFKEVLHSRTAYPKYVAPFHPENY